MKRSITLLAATGLFVFGIMAGHVAAEERVFVCHFKGHNFGGEKDFIIGPKPISADARKACKLLGGKAEPADATKVCAKHDNPDGCPLD